jgi:PTS system nitrogen regulatory IIA component
LQLNDGLPNASASAAENTMKISDFLSPTDVTLDVAVADKQKLLLALARRTAVDVAAEHICAELQKREELGSTGVGGGVALPHARFHQIGRPYGMMVRLRKPIAFDAVDEQPVDLVFLLLLPETANGEQLGALALIARTLRKPETVAGLRAANDSETM